jgi:ubiquinone/menaquinone biosynthesis C-methylase UbiE
MQKNQKKFYDDLMCKKSNFTFFTKDTRFNVNKLLNKKNINKYFDDFINKFIQNNDKILDFGCGPGTMFMELI